LGVYSRDTEHRRGYRFGWPESLLNRLINGTRRRRVPHRFGITWPGFRRRHHACIQVKYGGYRFRGPTVHPDQEAVHRRATGPPAGRRQQFRGQYDEAVFALPTIY
jgi:hypothetical protein